MITTRAATQGLAPVGKNPSHQHLAATTGTKWSRNVGVHDMALLGLGPETKMLDLPNTFASLEKGNQTIFADLKNVPKP